MTMGIKQVLWIFIFSLALFGCNTKEFEHEISKSLRAAPDRNVEKNIIDGSGFDSSFSSEDVNIKLGEKKGGRKVSVSTVAVFTLAMAAATGLGSVPFFFVVLVPEWAGICNGIAAGVMLAASFDLIQEGQDHGSGNWVVIGILAGGIFIWLCKKFDAL